jgi:hypothetical protein
MERKSTSGGAVQPRRGAQDHDSQDDGAIDHALHRHAILCAERSWALMLLHEGSTVAVEGEPSEAAMERSYSALALTLKRHEVIDAVFQRRYCAMFVQSAQLLETVQFPIADAVAYDRRALGERPGCGAFGRLEVVVTHESWLTHLRPGMTWDSNAFAPFCEGDGAPSDRAA